MHILVTNDDGITAKGIRILAKELANIGRVTVVAPDRERSAQSQALTLNKPIIVNNFDMKTNNVKAWQTSGTPSDCIIWGLVELLKNDKPNIVAAGINHGTNLGINVMYSGTVGAAIEGLNFGLPALAISMDINGGKEADFSIAAKYASKLLFKLLEEKKPLLLNINVPNKNIINGISITTIGENRFKNTFERRIDPRGRIYYWMGGIDINDSERPKSDVEALRAGKISITPLQFDFNDYQTMKKISSWEIN